MSLNNVANLSYDIYIVGLGISHIDQITREAERCMEASNEILYVERGLGIDAFLASKCKCITDLTRLYAEGEDRQGTYRKMAATVVKAALERPPVTFALYGHPLIYSYPPFLIREMAGLLGLSVKVVPGVSAMDCIFADLFVDPSMNGIQMFEATEMLLRGRLLQTDVAALIWQIGALETGLYSTYSSRPERFQRFKDHLLRFYPSHHTVFAVHSATHSLLKPEIYEFEISDIGDYASVLHAGFSMYIPPLESRPFEDWKLAAEMNDAKHLLRITSLQIGE